MKGFPARLFIGLQHVLPQHGLSRLVLRATRVRRRWFKDLLIRGFLKLFAVDMRDAVESDPFQYESFNAFFTRRLRAESRPIDADPDSVVSPADGAVSECGHLVGDQLLQAKGRQYTLADVLARHPLAHSFTGGSFATIYLAPFNYHRVHMAVRGTLIDTVYVPGRLFSVNAVTARHVPRLFARNERVITLFDTDFGRFALILVGALNVGSIATTWAGDITPARRRRLTTLGGARPTLDKGAELGRFNMGSTVILLFEPGRVAWHPLLRAEAVVQVGRP
ncbi:MAG: archaetidylserine decarboxylase, partial [Pseudomonadota bacterium]|nr:archaetidylserine decarboxylase [Pseudomonadota bacterium]